MVIFQHLKITKCYGVTVLRCYGVVALRRYGDKFILQKGGVQTERGESLGETGSFVRGKWRFR